MLLQLSALTFAAGIVAQDPLLPKLKIAPYGATTCVRYGPERPGIINNCYEMSYTHNEIERHYTWVYFNFPNNADMAGISCAGEDLEICEI